MKEIQEIDTDVLVIGGGSSGCWAALEASKQDIHVALVNKYTFGRSGTTLTGLAGYAAIMGELGQYPQDTTDIYFEDLLKGGAYLGEQNLMEILIRRSRETVLQLERMGVKWDKINGKYHLRGNPGNRFPRCSFSDDRTGLVIQKALAKQIVKSQNVQVLERKITKLLISNGQIAGAMGYHLSDGTIIRIIAKAVVLATGGAGQLFKISSMPEGARGDGYALAYKAGAALIDMEYQQFYPATLAYPETLRGLLAPIGTCIPLGARILNANGERFMHKYDPESENPTRDVASIAIFKEIKNGVTTPHGGVYLDVSAVENVLERYPTTFKDFKKAGINLPEEWIEICPGAHFTIGGVKINEFCETTVPGLYAAGEVAGNLHGANRIAGSALPECSVFGQIAGENAAIYSKFKYAPKLKTSEGEGEIERITKLYEPGGRGEIRPIQIIRALQKVMYDKVGVLRTHKELLEAIQEIEELKGRMDNLNINKNKHYNNEVLDALEVADMLLLAEIIAKAALIRKESRGAHYREDFPRQNDTEWLKHSTAFQVNGHLEISTCPITVTRNIMDKNRRDYDRRENPTDNISI